MLGSLLVVALALPPSNQTVRLQLDASGQLDVRSLQSDRFLPTLVPPPGEAFGGGGSLGITVFGRPVRDDDAAPPLQPFLQRVARFHVEGGGAHESITYPFTTLNTQEPSAFLARYEASNVRAHAAVAADGYLGRWLQLGASFALDYQSWAPKPYGLTVGGFAPSGPASAAMLSDADSNELSLSAAASVGLRWRELLVAAGFSVTPYRLGAGSLHVRFWGGAFVAGRAVVRRCVELSARVDVLDGGAAAEGSATLWLRRRIGVTVGVDGGHGALFDSPVLFDRAGGQLGVDWWFGPRLAAALRYAPSWQRTTPVAGLGVAERPFSFVAHLVTLTVTSRASLRR